MGWGFTIYNDHHKKQEKPKHRPTELVLDKESKVPGNWIFQMVGETQLENPKPRKSRTETIHQQPQALNR